MPKTDKDRYRAAFWPMRILVSVATTSAPRRSNEKHEARGKREYSDFHDVLLLWQSKSIARRPFTFPLANPNDRWTRLRRYLLVDLRWGRIRRIISEAFAPALAS